jgi:hypothetical protein
MPVPIDPPPPGLFSTTTGWSHSLDKPSATMRAPVSLMPPGEDGTMMVTALVGKSCA